MGIFKVDGKNSWVGGDWAGEQHGHQRKSAMVKEKRKDESPGLPRNAGLSKSNL